MYINQSCVLFTIGGVTEDNIDSDKIYELNADTEDWEILSNLFTPRRHPGASYIQKDLTKYCQ